MDGPLRILHVVVNMNRGGAETLIMNLYRNIDRTKVQFDFLTSKEGVFDQEIHNLGGRIHRIPYITEAGHRGYSRQLSQFFRRNQNYLIVHSHMDKMSGLVLKEAKKAGLPVRIAHSHNTKSEGNFVSKAYKWYVGEEVKSAATHLFACSTEAAKWLFKSQYNQTYFLKNGIESDKFCFSAEVRNTVRRTCGVSDQSLVLGHVGRFNHQKNHMFLLEVFAELRKKQADAQLLLVGDGPLREKIEAKIKELKIEKSVHLLGVREDIHHLLQAFDIFVFPSFHEGLPVTLIEAQAAGLPCIISDKITKEVIMSDELVTQLAIDKKEAWVASIEKASNQKAARVSMEAILNKNGYDIRETAKELQKLYLMLEEGSSENINRLYSNVQ